MFWKRASAWGGFFSLVAGTTAAYATNSLAAYHLIFHFDSPLSASFWQAIIAFITSGVVLVVVSLVTKPKPTRELAGRVWGMANREDVADIDPPDKLWWRSPWLLGGGAIACRVVRRSATL